MARAAPVVELQKAAERTRAHHHEGGHVPRDPVAIGGRCGEQQPPAEREDAGEPRVVVRVDVAGRGKGKGKQEVYQGEGRQHIQGAG